jgi:F0F1-type ATP synthase epsilon subunit
MPADPKMFELKVISPYKKYYQGSVISLSAVNKRGPFDVLAQHANFFSLLLPCTVRFNTGSDVREVPITTGILRVSQNKATLFVNI